jgi:hypothetical protein
MWPLCDTTHRRQQHRAEFEKKKSIHREHNKRSETNKQSTKNTSQREKGLKANVHLAEGKRNELEKRRTKYLL